ncbi:MAG: hypothetical protein Q7T79_00045 [bacterium]|nr:hypothetical protein [bacterium]
MQVAEFRSKIKLNIKLSIEDKVFTIKEVVKFKFNKGDFYIKCFLSDGYVFADDIYENEFLLVKEIKTQFKQPFPPELNFDNKKFKFLYNAYAIAEEIQGEQIFKKGDSEKFWDYKADDGSYLSLGIVEKTNRRLDFYGKIIANNAINLIP